MPPYWLIDVSLPVSYQWEVPGLEMVPLLPPLYHSPLLLPPVPPPAPPPLPKICWRSREPKVRQRPSSDFSQHTLYFDCVTTSAFQTLTFKMFICSWMPFHILHANVLMCVQLVAGWIYPEDLVVYPRPTNQITPRRHPPRTRPLLSPAAAAALLGNTIQEVDTNYQISHTSVAT